MKLDPFAVAAWTAIAVCCGALWTVVALWWLA